MRGRWWILLVLAGVPAALAVIWLLRTAPVRLECGDAVGPGRQRIVDDWLRGAGPIFGVAALIVLGAIAQISCWRRTDRGKATDVGGPTVVVGTLLVLYIVASAIETDLFLAYYLGTVIAATLWYAVVPMVGLPTVGWLITRPPGQRAIAVVQVAGWGSLLLGVGAIAMAVAIPATDPWCFD